MLAITALAAGDRSAQAVLEVVDAIVACGCARRRGAVDAKNEGVKETLSRFHSPFRPPALCPPYGPGEKLRGTGLMACSRRPSPTPVHARRGAGARARPRIGRGRSRVATVSLSRPLPLPQAFKFALYVTIPAVLTLAVATNADVLNKVIKQVG